MFKSLLRYRKLFSVIYLPFNVNLSGKFCNVSGSRFCLMKPSDSTVTSHSEKLLKAYEVVLHTKCTLLSIFGLLLRIKNILHYVKCLQEAHFGKQKICNVFNRT